MSPRVATRQVLPHESFKVAGTNFNGYWVWRVRMSFSYFISKGKMRGKGKEERKQKEREKAPRCIKCVRLSHTYS